MSFLTIPRESKTSSFNHIDLTVATITGKCTDLYFSGKITDEEFGDKMRTLKEIRAILYGALIDLNTLEIEVKEIG